MTDYNAEQTTERIVTLDIEASGFGSSSYPLEVGIVLSNGESWCSLIKPEPHWTHWSMEAQAIHLITPEQLQERGKPIKEIALALNACLKGKTVYSDCWVLDDRWLRKLFENARIKPSFRLQDITYILKEEQFPDWEKTKQTIANELDISRHRATNDARILQEAFYRINK